MPLMPAEDAHDLGDDSSRSGLLIYRVELGHSITATGEQAALNPACYDKLQPARAE